MTTTEVVVLTIGGTIVGCLCAVCWATVQLARINARKETNR